MGTHVITTNFADFQYNIYLRKSYLYWIVLSWKTNFTCLKYIKMINNINIRKYNVEISR